MGNIIVGGILIAIVAAIIASMVRKHRTGKSVLCDSCEDSSTCNGHCGLTDEMLDDMRRALDEHDAQRAGQKRAQVPADADSARAEDGQAQHSAASDSQKKSA
ncbi:MAG: FeoB-associated Cys-rich membrane protein [Eggerthellaceae bacterium]|jgi:delta-aminolevulinic acid dehydratase/porphobilinogen synthase